MTEADISEGRHKATVRRVVRWLGHVQRRDAGYAGEKKLRTELPERRGRPRRVGTPGSQAVAAGPRNPQGHFTLLLKPCSSIEGSP